MSKIIQNKILALRKKDLSYSAIASELKVSKSTVAYWLKGVDWSKNIQNKISKNHQSTALFQNNIEKMAKINRERWQIWRETARKEAIQEFDDLKNIPLFISGVMLYWGEGDSNVENGLVRLSNVTEQIIILFIKFLQKCCNVADEDIIFTLILYPDNSELTCKNYWKTKFPISNPRFYKTQRIVGRHSKKKLGYGICNVLVKSRALKEKIIVWQKLLFDYI